jgi:hypothetical protein
LQQDILLICVQEEEFLKRIGDGSLKNAVATGWLLDANISHVALFHLLLIDYWPESQKVI